MELLRDRSAEFEGIRVQTFGVSRDSPWTHIAWIQALDLNFPLLSDDAQNVTGTTLYVDSGYHAMGM